LNISIIILINNFIKEKQLLLHKTAGKVSSISILDLNEFDCLQNIRSHKILALCSMNVVLIVTLEPTVVMLARLEKPESVNEGCIPSVSWGKGVYVGNNY